MAHDVPVRRIGLYICISHGLVEFTDKSQNNQSKINIDKTLHWQHRTRVISVAIYGGYFFLNQNLYDPLNKKENYAVHITILF